MNKELMEALTALCEEKGMSPDIIFDALEAALVDLSEGVLEPVRFDEFYHPWPEADDTPR